MARLFTTGFETGVIASEPDWSSTTGAIAIEGTVVNSGSEAVSAAGSAGSQFVTFRYSASALPLATIIYSRVFVRISANPSVALACLQLIDSGFAGPGAIKISAAGKLQLFDNVGQVGSDSATALTPGVWYMVECAAQVNGTTTGYVEGRLNGVSFASTNAGRNNGVGLRDLRVGIASSAAPTATIYVDDIAVNDNSGATNNSWVGAIPSPAVNTVLPAITGTAAKGTLLKVGTGTWTGTVVSYTYQWKRNGSAIPGMSGNAYMLVAADVGATITCDVGAVNDGGTTIATTAATASVASATVVVPPIPAVSQFRAVNYWPVNNSWEGMWATWDPASIDADMARVSGLNANLVRCIVNAEASWFGYPTPSAAMLNRLDQFIAIAVSHGVLPYLTLFDTLASFTDITGSKTWASTVLAPYAGDPRIAFIELKNEILVSDVNQMAWTTALLPYVRGLMPGTMTTISTSDPTGAASTLWTPLFTALDQYLDFYDLHLYNKLARCYTTMKQCRDAVAPKKLWIGETGCSTEPTYTTVGGLPLGTLVREQYQDFWFRSFALAAATLGMPKVTPWLFQDVTAGSKPTGGVAALGQAYGLFRADGSEKPACATVRAYFGTGAISTDFGGDFETLVDGTLPAIWQQLNTGLATFARDATDSSSGVASAKISAAAGDSSNRPSFFNSLVVPCKPGARYQLSFRAKGNAVTGVARGNMAWTDASEVFITNFLIATPTGTFGWTQFRGEATAPANASYAIITLETYGNTGSISFDDVHFVEVQENWGGPSI